MPSSLSCEVGMQTIDNSVDQLVLVDLSDNVTGSCEKIRCHQQGLLHRAFSVFLFDGERLLITKRAPHKYHSGGLWTNACCSHPRVGEPLEDAVRRRLEEELGIVDAECNEVGNYCYRATFDDGISEYEFDHVYLGHWSGVPAPDPKEAVGARWVALSEVKRAVQEMPDEFTSWFPGTLAIALSALEGTR